MKNWAGVFLVALLAGCAAIPAGGDPSAMAAQRAKERWEALIDRDLDKAYSYLSTGSRQTMSLESYKARVRAGMWRSVEVKSAKCQAAVCKVALSIEYEYRVMKRLVKGIQTELVESWLIEDGNAWLVYEG